MIPGGAGRAPSVLAAVDGPAGVSAVLLVARELSRLLAATPRLLFVSRHAAAPRGAARLLGLQREDLHGVTLDAVRGDLHTEILREARVESTRLVVLDLTLGGAAGPGRVGAAAAALLADAPCPLVLVPPGRCGAPWRVNEVLLAHDGTPTTAEAVRRASDLARSAGAWLRVLHVATAPEAAGEPGAMAVPRYLDQPQHEWPVWAEEFLQRLSSVCRFDLHRLRLVLGHGQPGDEVLRVAQESRVDLVLLACRGALGPDRGRTVRTVLGGSPCPVMVVRTMGA